MNGCFGRQDVLVSVVVPIYNVENYISMCVESLLSQTLVQLEIILVDDGSLDNSGKIADAYSKQDSRIKVVHQENAGLGPARNTGLKYATGEYIGFLDSDDWVGQKMYEKLYFAAKQTNADIIVGGHCETTNGRIIETKAHPLANNCFGEYNDISAVRKNLFGHALLDKQKRPFPVSVCTSIYRRAFIQDNELSFMNIMSEDTIFNLCAYDVAKTITFTDGTDYYYRKDGQVSISQSYSAKKGANYIGFLKKLAQLAADVEGNECAFRVSRTTIEYYRSFASVVERSKLPFEEKKSQIAQFAEDEFIRECWEIYPQEYLPIQQRIFHVLAEKGYYGSVIVLCYLRRMLKRMKLIFNRLKRTKKDAN